MSRLRLCLCVGVSLLRVTIAAAQVTPLTPVTSPPPASALVARWLDVQALQLQTRYHFVAPATTAPDTNQMQSWDTLRLRIKADPAGRIAVGLGWLSGPNFTGSWNDTGIGTGTTRLHSSLRLLSLDVAPIAGVMVQIGSLPISRGESTEFTSYDNDGYTTGERITIRRPKDLFFDEVTVTRGYLGDATKPSVFDRLDHRLADVNYRQYLLSRHIAKRASASAELSRYNGATIVRGAARVQTKEAHLIDALRWEQYVRHSPTETVAGFTVTGEKQLTQSTTTAAGYGDIDKNYGGLNADRFNRGRRVYGMLTYAFSPVVSVSTYVGRAVLNDYPVSNHTRFDVTLSYNLLAHLQRSGVLPK